LESRCYAAEAVLGILISLPDQRATDLLTELSDDRFVQNVLDQVNRGAFGLRGREPTLPELDLELKSSAGSSRDAPTCLSESHSRSLCLLIQDSDPFTHGPTNGWQNSVIDEFRAKDEGNHVEPFGRRSMVSTPATLTDDESPGHDTTVTDGETGRGKKTRKD